MKITTMKRVKSGGEKEFFFFNKKILIQGEKEKLVFAFSFFFIFF